MKELSKVNIFEPLKMNDYLNLNENEEIIKQTFIGSHNLKINKYMSQNVTVIEGITGSGKTYYMEKFLSLDSSKKLLLARKSDCEHEYLTTENITKIGYYEELYDFITSGVNLNNLLLQTLKTEVIKGYDVIIIDNIFFNSLDSISKLFEICLQYPKTNFFIINNDQMKSYGYYK